MVALPDGKKIEDKFIRFDRIHERDGRTYRRRPHNGLGRECIASRGNEVGTLATHQRGWDWAGPQPAPARPRCTKCNSFTKCNSPSINGQCTNHRISSVAVRF